MHLGPETLSAPCTPSHPVSSQPEAAGCQPSLFALELPWPWPSGLLAPATPLCTPDSPSGSGHRLLLLPWVPLSGGPGLCSWLRGDFTVLRVLGCMWPEQAGGSFNSLLHIYKFPESMMEVKREMELLMPT